MSLRSGRGRLQLIFLAARRTVPLPSTVPGYLARFLSQNLVDDHDDYDDMAGDDDSSAPKLPTRSLKDNLKTPKGTRDWSGPSMVLREQVFSQITDVFKVRCSTTRACFLPTGWTDTCL